MSDPYYAASDRSRDDIEKRRAAFKAKLARSLVIPCWLSPSMKMPLPCCYKQIATLGTARVSERPDRSKNLADKRRL